MRTWALTFLLVANAAMGGAPDQFAAVAGPRPAEPQARAVINAEVAKRAESPRDLSRLRFTSGPHLVTGINFADGREQAWLMCTITGDSDLRRGGLSLDTRPWLLRNKGDHLEVVPLAGWKDSDIDC